MVTSDSLLATARKTRQHAWKVTPGPETPCSTNFQLFMVLGTLRRCKPCLADAREPLRERNSETLKLAVATAQVQEVTHKHTGWSSQPWKLLRNVRPSTAPEEPAPTPRSNLCNHQNPVIRHPKPCLRLQPSMEGTPLQCFPSEPPMLGLAVACTFRWPPPCCVDTPMRLETTFAHMCSPRGSGPTPTIASLPRNGGTSNVGQNFLHLVLESLREMNANLILTNSLLQVLKASRDHVQFVDSPMERPVRPPSST